MSIVNLQPDAHASRLAAWKDVTQEQPAGTLRRMVYLGLGSNLGDRRAMLQRAVDELRRLPSTELLRCSGVYETEPWGMAGQGAFLNCAVELRSGLDPRTLLESLLGIERILGRERRERNGPRIIDIDILLYGAEVIEEDGLCIPHPAMTGRNFVLQPLRELAASVQHPVEAVTIEELALRCADTGGVADTGLRLETTARRM
jgi:2-amino-4-hydroxy-6-hydroxymethyldihydropteridine diphosphokinase